jgi:dTDP-4-dehydrorhamnose 3,5-epimerase
VKKLETTIEGLLLIEPRVFKDERGYFFESFSTEKMAALGLNESFVQDNESLSQKGVIRGLHFQAPPFDQGKLVRVVKGAVLDVVVDIRVGSPTYGSFFAVELSELNKHMFYIPPGFAHGFATLEDNTVFQYKCTNGYNQASEGSVNCMDPDLGIPWPFSAPLLSHKDREAKPLSELISPFTYAQ